MKGIITRLPEGNQRGAIQKEEARRGVVMLDAQAIAAAGLALAVGSRVAFDTETRGGFIFAVNLRDPANEPVLPVLAAQAPARGEAPEQASGSSPATAAPPPAHPSPSAAVRSEPNRAPGSGSATMAAHDCARHQSTKPLPGTRETTPAPYTFVPIHTQGGTAVAHLDTPVLHDGQPSIDRLSGELHIEIEALTPLLAGQHRYDWERLRSADGAPLVSGHFSRGKKVLEPAVVDFASGRAATVSPGTGAPAGAWASRRVMIPATSIKGVIRQAVAAMLNAPMERVGERYLSYRPNVDTSNVPQPRYKPYAAVVQRVEPDGSAEIRLLANMNSVLFVESPPDTLIASREERDRQTLQRLQEQLKPSRLQRPQRPSSPRLPGERPVLSTEQNELERGGEISNYHRPQGQNRGQSFPLNRLQYTRGGTWGVDRPYLVCHYACGIDGDFRMAKLTRDQHERKARAGEDAGGEMTARHYFRALIPNLSNTFLPGTMTIGPALERQHRALLRELADTRSGHFSRLPRSFWGENLSDAGRQEAMARMGKHITDNGLRPYQLIYLEAALDPQGAPMEVLSFGTHFRYRWRYANSVREVAIDPETGVGTPRAELSPAAGEGIQAPDDAFAAGRLSGARLLFGYVADKDTNTAGIGTGSFSRLAGRIALNHALEEPREGRLEPEQRFLWFGDAEGEARFLLPLRILGAPKPSAVEHYVQQDGIESQPGATITYGDLPGDAGGALNGRKFYRHQPLPLGEGQLTGGEPFLAEDEATCRSDQAPLARLVSRPGTRYRCTLRFRDLREWELGALLVAIQPTLLEALSDAERPQPLNDLLRRVRAGRGPQAQDPLFAHKLGFARPLGFGSIRMTIGAARSLGAEPSLTPEAQLPQWRTRMIRAFLKAMAGQETGLLDWLTVNRYAGQPLADYPRDRDGKVFGYHTRIRLSHAKQRRNANPAARNPPPDLRIKRT